MDIETTVHDLAPRVLRYCRGRSATAELAEEAAQDALSALVARWRRHGPPRSPEAFVFTVARRRLARALLRRRLLAPLEALTNGHGPPAPDDPEARTARRRELERVHLALRELSSREREALLLVAAGELSTGEAAEVLGISRSALKMRVHRARGRLARLLESDEGAQG